MNTNSASKRILLTIAAALVLATSSIGWAADATPSAGRGVLQLSDPVKVAGTQLQSGKYRVEWAGAGDQVEVKIYSGTQAVVSTHARLVKADKDYDYLTYTPGAVGTRSLIQISYAKQKCALQLEDQSANTGAQRAAK